MRFLHEYTERRKMRSSRTPSGTRRGPAQPDVTELLRAMRAGDADALGALVALVYDELHELARVQRRRWHGNPTLNATAIVNEAYVKLVAQGGRVPESRAHFFAAAAKAMRHILCNYARDRRRLKRGAGIENAPIEDAVNVSLLDLSDEQQDELYALSEAILRLEAVNRRQSEVVECRFFGGMTVEATASALGLSVATVKRDWAVARAWLYREIRNESSDERKGDD